MNSRKTLLGSSHAGAKYSGFRLRGLGPLQAILALIGVVLLFNVARIFTSPTLKKLDLRRHYTPLVIVTPTYRRVEQAAALAYLSTILKASKGQLFWLLIDDGRASPDQNLLSDLTKSGVPYWFIKPILKKDCPGYTFGNCFNKEGHRGVAQRNLALRFIREKLYLYCDIDRVNGILNKDTSDYGHVDPYLGEQGSVLGRGLCPLDEVPRLLQHEPIVYFADDDNLYEIDLFREVAKTKNFGIVPVGFPWKSPRYVSAPVIGTSGAIQGFDTFLCLDRVYPVDMANIAFSARFLHEARSTPITVGYVSGDWLKPYANGTAGKELVAKYNYKESGVPPVRFYLHSRKYHLETDLLEQLVEGMHEVEVLADGATRVLAWHVAKEKTQEEQFNKNKIGRYVTHVNQPATPKCKIRL